MENVDKPRRSSDVRKVVYTKNKESNVFDFDRF